MKIPFKVIVLILTLCLTTIGISTIEIFSSTGELTPLGFLTCVGIVISFFLIVAFIIEYWDNEIKIF